MSAHWRGYGGRHISVVATGEALVMRGDSNLRRGISARDVHCVKYLRSFVQIFFRVVDIGITDSCVNLFFSMADPSLAMPPETGEILAACPYADWSFSQHTFFLCDVDCRFTAQLVLFLILAVYRISSFLSCS